MPGYLGEPGPEARFGEGRILADEDPDLRFAVRCPACRRPAQHVTVATLLNRAERAHSAGRTYFTTNGWF